MPRGLPFRAAITAQGCLIEDKVPQKLIDALAGEKAGRSGSIRSKTRTLTIDITLPTTGAKPYGGQPNTH